MIDKHLLRPIAYEPLVRLGNQGDGGYVVPRPCVEQARFLLSLGINDDISFDLDFTRHNPAVRTLGVDFSSTPAYLRQRYCRSAIHAALYRFIDRSKHALYRRKCEVIRAFPAFFANGNELILKKVSAEPGAGMITIGELVARCGESDRCDTFVKMDIEGAEFEVIEDLARHHARLNCLAIEFHNLHRVPQRFNGCLEALREYFHPVHIHGNNFGGYCTEQKFPHTIELTLINKTLVADNVQPSCRSYPVAGLDFACSHKRPDYSIVFEERTLPTVNRLT